MDGIEFLEPSMTFGGASCRWAWAGTLLGLVTEYVAAVDIFSGMLE
jgi:hypothetical protein